MQKRERKETHFEASLPLSPIFYPLRSTFYHLHEYLKAKGMMAQDRTSVCFRAFCAIFQAKKLFH
jgi:hypothetical protein